MPTGGSIALIARVSAKLIDQPPVLPSVGQSVLVPVVTGRVMAALLSGLAWALSRPLRLQRRAFGAVAIGRLDLRMTLLLGSQRDEFAQLALDYDRMAHQLQARLGAQCRQLHDVSQTISRMEGAVERMAALVGENHNGLLVAGGKWQPRGLDLALEGNGSHDFAGYGPGVMSDGATAPAIRRCAHPHTRRGAYGRGRRRWQPPAGEEQRDRNPKAAACPPTT